jgi:hypothetical protein
MRDEIERQRPGGRPRRRARDRLVTVQDKICDELERRQALRARIAAVVALKPRELPPPLPRRPKVAAQAGRGAWVLGAG